MLQALRTFFRKLRGAGVSPMKAGVSRHHTTSTEDREIGVIALVASDQDRQLLATVALDQGWRMKFVDTCQEARDLLNRRVGPIVLCDRDMPGTDWRETMRIVTSSSISPYAILLSRVADDYLWNEVVQLGGFDVLTMPLREAEVLRAIRLGWSYWSSSMSMGPLLAKHTS